MGTLSAGRRQRMGTSSEYPATIRHRLHPTAIKCDRHALSLARVRDTVGVFLRKDSRRMPRSDVNTLADGVAVDEVYLLSDKQLRVNRVGDQYLLAQLRDRTGQISGLLWNVKEPEMARISG